MIDNKAFEDAKEKIIGVDRQRLGIGTLSEKTVHAILKNYYEPDEDHQEIPIENYVADIYHEGSIMEIQTRSFNAMRNKLRAFLPLYPVTIIYPIPREKWLIWIDEETGQLSNKRKSPLKGNGYTVFPELYKIKMFLKDPNLRFKLVLLDMEEYRLLNGWSKDKKKGSSRFDRIPTQLVEEIDIECLQDYMQFVPYDLPEEFTVKDFAKAAHIPARRAQMVVHILAYVGVIEQIGKKGNAYLYQVRE
ncbi:MAG: hypothetical protein IJ327_02635 [Lachnospiraceae bacterium]|nr:hypothetical protein [Lachnospiraceae bacterium]